MKIIDKRTITPGNFGKLEVGDVFYIERFEGMPENYESDLYMKTGVQNRQCVNLVTGELIHFSHWDEVQKVIATVVVTSYIDKGRTE